MPVLKNKSSNIAIVIAETEKEIVLCHRMSGPCELETFVKTREFAQWWLPTDIDSVYCARRFLSGELVEPSFLGEAEAALLRITGVDLPPVKLAEKAERKETRANSPSARARRVLAETGFSSKAYYAKCVELGIDKRTAASVLCIERKRNAPAV